MSLTYIIDGYNLINHPLFSQKLRKSKDPRIGLAESISTGRLCGSAKNKVIIVFDGYPPVQQYRQAVANIEMLFSKDATADARIKKILEQAANPKVLAVVSDDKEIKFFARACLAKTLSIEEFAQVKKERSKGQKDKDLSKDALSYSQMESINKELKKIWLGNPKFKQ